MKIMLIMLLFVPTILLADNDPEANNEAIARKSNILVGLIGEELIARYGEDLVDNMLEGKDKNVKKIISDIEDNELNNLDCFTITDYFGELDNKYKPNRDLDMELMRDILLNCEEIMLFLEPFGGVSDVSMKYFLSNSVLRYS